MAVHSEPRVLFPRLYRKSEMESEDTRPLESREERKWFLVGAAHVSHVVQSWLTAVRNRPAGTPLTEFSCNMYAWAVLGAGVLPAVRRRGWRRRSDRGEGRQQTKGRHRRLRAQATAITGKGWAPSFREHGRARKNGSCHRVSPEALLHASLPNRQKQLLTYSTRWRRGPSSPNFFFPSPPSH